MGKKKAKPEDPHRGRQLNFRVYDERLVAALDHYAGLVRHKRNMAITLLLEQALGLHGLWPPPPKHPS